MAGTRAGADGGDTDGDGAGAGAGGCDGVPDADSCGPLAGGSTTAGGGGGIVAAEPDVAAVPRFGGIVVDGREITAVATREAGGLSGIDGDRMAISPATPRNPAVTAAAP